jgi:LacI family transcriptional regulator
MSITIKEIAEMANVSTATVSMVINNKPGISTPTRKKVLSIVETCGYIISPLKNSLALNNGTIQLTIYKKYSQIATDTAFFEALIGGIESKTSLSGYQLTIKSVVGRNLDIDLIYSKGNGTARDGILLLGTEMKRDDMLRITKLDIPLLVVDACFMGINSNYVAIDNVSGVFMGVNHLIDNGHIKIGYLQSSIPMLNFLERYEGYEKALHMSGISCNYDYTVQLRPTIDGAYDDMSTYLSKNPKLPTAYFADNDVIAFGAIKALKEKSVRIPDDVSIVGFDDIPFCTVVEPALSTVSVNKKVLGEIAVENLINLMSNNYDYHSKTLLGVELISRDSVLSIN